MKKENPIPELLSPAGSEEALHAAVDSGADAVYLGSKAFGARASAVNFDDETLTRAVEYAHLHHARVHVTVNTLVKEKEFSGVRETLRAIAAAKADAVIVQDLGVAALVRDEFPALKLHASTQMALSNASDARFARDFGYDRVVLARECSLDEIRRVAETGVETEVFAHGALCTAVSGRCLMSSMAGGRSGNRGRCAQPCRMRFQWNGREAAWLSLKDLCAYPILKELWDAGVCSLKLEGRLKSPEYVAVVTEAYRRALDDLAAGRFDPEDPAPMEKLRQIFNRGGFTRGHAGGAEDAALCAPERVSHEGLPLGTVTSVRGNLARVRLIRSLHDGDSLQLRQRQDADLRYSGPEISAGQEAVLRLRPGLTAAPGAEVARLSDARQLEAARSHAPRPISIQMHGVFALNRPMALTLSDSVSTVTVEGQPVQTAAKRAAAEEEVRRQLERLGDTPFVLESPEDLKVELADGLFLPVSALNALRREGIAALTAARIEAFWQAGQETHTRARKPWGKALPTTGGEPLNADSLTVSFSDPAMADELLQCGANRLWFQPRSYRPADLEHDLNRLPDGCWLVLPVQCTEPELHVIRRAAETAKLGGVVAQSMGQVSFADHWPVFFGDGLPATNRRALEALRELPVSGFTLWPEWTEQEQRELMPLPLPALCPVYGRERLMILNHCPARVREGLSHGREACRLCRTPDQACGQTEPVLRDQRGYAFPLRRTSLPGGCQVNVYNALPTDLRAFDGERRALGAGMLARFTTEPPEEQRHLTELFAALRDGLAVPPAVNVTAGHWRRGVE
ncbi:MAG: U32 family peptidase [Candidatus Limiplasma sp.]|nr:U32 family peptidase [Candidatus Limiplasma sp.]